MARATAARPWLATRNGSGPQPLTAGHQTFRRTGVLEASNAKARAAPGAPMILALGSVNADFQVRVERRPELGETLLGRDFVQLGGGKAANVAFLARRLGVRAQLLARVGGDALAGRALGPLREIGVDLSRVTAVEGDVSGVSMIAVPPDGGKTIILAPNANQSWTRQDADETAAAVEAAPAGSVLAADYEVPGFVVERAVVAAARRRLTVVLDPSPADRVADDLLSRVDVITPNPSEAGKLTGIVIDGVGTAATAGRRLVERGVGAAAVKLPGGGCVLVQAEQITHVPPVPVEVTDTTGAGDAFAGALAVALLERRPLPEAACFAAAASQVAVAGYGSQPSYPSRAQLCPLFRQLSSGARVLEPP
jgi:ribokinase